MPTLATDVRLAYEQHTTPGTLYYECKRCGRKTKSYRKITRHLDRCASKAGLEPLHPEGERSEQRAG
jgi:hypothetical protein